MYVRTSAVVLQSRQIVRNFVAIYMFHEKKKCCATKKKNDSMTMIMYKTQPLTYEEPHVRLPIQPMLVHLAQDPPRSHHVEQADDDPRVLPAEVPHRVRRVRQERLPGHDLYTDFLAMRF